MVELQQAEVEDGIAALYFLKSQLVDSARIAISGCLMAASKLSGERELGVRALVPRTRAIMGTECAVA
jgi:hypothetical protein